MKIIHTSDLHLDSKIDGIPTEKSRIRREEVVASFEKMVEFANQNDVRAIIIAGDMFDTSRVTIKTKERVLGTIKKYRNIDFLYVAGNHDEINFLSLTDELPCNFFVFNDEWSTVDYDNIVVAGVNLNSVNQNAIYDTLTLDANKINIVVMHGQVAGYNSNQNAEIISIPKLKNKNIDYLALGHIHSYSFGEIDERGNYAYSGCLEGRGFDELGQKGFVLLDCADGKVNTTFVPFSTRINYEKEYDVTSVDTFFELVDLVKQDLANTFNSSSLVKVVLKGEHKPEFYIDKAMFEKKLNDMFFFAKVYDKTELVVNPVDYELDKSVRGEFVRAVWESNLTKEQKNKIIMCGLSALKGEEI